MVLCFLPPFVPPPREPLPPRPRGRLVMTWSAGFIVVSALFLPVGWIHTRPIYQLRVGTASRLGPRAEERGLVARLGAEGAATKRVAYFASHDAYGAVPPGLDVDGATGALVGTPVVPGTYTLAVGASDGINRSVTGPSFQIKVLPAS